MFFKCVHFKSFTNILVLVLPIPPVKSQKSNVKCQMSNVKCQKYQMSNVKNIKCQISYKIQNGTNGTCQMSNVKSNVKCQ